MSSARSDLADLDGDALPDFVAGVSGLPLVEWAENSGPGSFPDETLITLPEPDELASVVGQAQLDYLECDTFGNDCCSLNRTAGCEDDSCEAIVCDENSSCCFDEWSMDCAQLAKQMCSICVDPAKPDCCDMVDPNKIGCEVQACEDIVCQMDTSCCVSTWDRFCLEGAQRWCSECLEYDVTCDEPDVRRARAADIDGDGDADLIALVQVLQYIEHPRNLIRPRPEFLTWIPNRQVEDPVTAAGDPLFAPALSPWQPIGLATPDFEVVDLDGDGDPDLLDHADARPFWYRNDAGEFAGPYALRGRARLPATSEEDDDPYAGPLLSADTDADADLDVIVSSMLYEQAPEPDAALGILCGIALLAALERRRCHV